MHLSEIVLSNDTYNVLLGLGTEGEFPVSVVVGAVGVFGVESEAFYKSAMRVVSACTNRYLSE